VRVILCRSWLPRELTQSIRRILFFPYGNNCECASLYLEHGFDDKPPENWYQCVQFGLVLWNPKEPTSYCEHRKLPQLDDGIWLDADV
jgi:ubiquitin carboxyl-terminal hydrolase 7